MSDSIVLRNFNDQGIRIRPEDRYVCLTDMAKASGKLFADWNKLKGSKSYLEALSSVMKIGITDLVQIVQGGSPELQGTWGHPKVALRFAQWCSDEFAVQVDIWIDELITTGKVELIPKPQVDPMLAQIQMLMDLRLAQIEQENRLKQIEASKAETELRLNAVEAEQDRYQYGQGHKFTIMGFARMQGLEISLKQAGDLGKRAAKFCRNRAIDIDKVRDPRWGLVGLYPESILIEVFQGGF